MNKRWTNILINISLWLFFAGGMIASLAFVEIKHASTQCTNLQINIIDKTNYLFVEPEDIRSMLIEKELNPIGLFVDSIKTETLEKAVLKHPSIKSAEVYITVNGAVVIDVEQKNPILRIINYNGESYYIDEDGALMPLSKDYTARVLVASGNINEPYTLRYTKDVTQLEDSDELGRNYILDDLFYLTRYIYNNSFWNAYIEQLFVNENGDIEMIPKVGNFEIILGNIDNMEEKFTNLKAFLETAIPREGWSKYSIINLKYKNQVVCTKNPYYEPTN